MVWVGDSEVKIILQNNGMEAFIPQVSYASRLAGPCIESTSCRGSMHPRRSPFVLEGFLFVSHLARLCLWHACWHLLVCCRGRRL